VGLGIALVAVTSLIAGFSEYERRSAAAAMAKPHRKRMFLADHRRRLSQVSEIGPVPGGKLQSPWRPVLEWDTPLRSRLQQQLRRLADATPPTIERLLSINDERASCGSPASPFPDTVLGCNPIAASFVVVPGHPAMTLHRRSDRRRK